MTQSTVSARHLPGWYTVIMPRPDFGPQSSGPSFPAIQTTHITLPYWCPIVIFLALTLLSGNQLRKAYRRQRLTKSGRCNTCGYDLRATPQLCPECGVIPD